MAPWKGWLRNRLCEGLVDGIYSAFCLDVVPNRNEAKGSPGDRSPSPLPPRHPRLSRRTQVLSERNQQDRAADRIVDPSKVVEKRWFDSDRT